MSKEILLLTGWGATCGVWNSIIPALDSRYHVQCHVPTWVMESKMKTSLMDFDEYIHELAAMFVNQINIIAWSMGGLIAIRLATLYPGRVKKICFLSSVSNFVDQHNAHAGIDYQWFQSFCNQYQQHPIRTLKKFLTLQVSGDEFAKTALARLKKICPFEQYNLRECRLGLTLLNDLDLTDQLIGLDCDTIFIHGEQDAVVQSTAAKHVAMLSQAPIHMISHAGHVPHVSHAQQVTEIINQYL